MRPSIGRWPRPKLGTFTSIISESASFKQPRLWTLSVDGSAYRLEDGAVRRHRHVRDRFSGKSKRAAPPMVPCMASSGGALQLWAALLSAAERF